MGKVKEIVVLSINVGAYIKNEIENFPNSNIYLGVNTLFFRNPKQKFKVLFLFYCVCSLHICYSYLIFESNLFLTVSLHLSLNVLVAISISRKIKIT